jgi:anthranilate synthase component 2
MVGETSLPTQWMITARDEEGRIMSMTHQKLPWQGVQFHPESVMTPLGKSILENWLLSC